MTLATFNLDGIPDVVRPAVAPGRYADDQLAAIHDVLVERLESWLTDAVTLLLRRDALLAVADYFAASLEPLQTTFLAGAFDDYANLGPALTPSVTGARYLMEMVIAYANGATPVSSERLAELNAAASALVVLSNLKTWRLTGAQRLSLIVDDNKRMEIIAEAATFDLQAYGIATNHYNLSVSLRPEQEALFRWLGHEGDLIHNHPWSVADAAMVNEYGCSLRTFMRTMAALATHPLPARRRIAVVKEVDLAAEVMQAFPVPDITEVHRSIAVLTADQSDIGKDLRAWQQRERSARLVTTPLFRATFSDELVIVPAFVLLATNVHVEYLCAGAWPGPEGARKNMTPFRQALKIIESQFNLEFERDVADQFERLGFIVRTTVKKIPGIAIVGDIDVLAVHHERREIWVVEVKDPITPHSPMQFASQARNFKEWSSKHLARVEVLSSPAGKAAVGGIFQVIDIQAFAIRSIIVTRNPSSTSFRTDMPERVIWLSALPSALDDE
jgi:hypothetical protein